MTNLDLKKMGLQELNAKEMIEFEGSGFWSDFLLGKAVDLIVDTLVHVKDNPGSGWDSTMFGHYGGARP